MSKLSNLKKIVLTKMLHVKNLKPYKDSILIKLIGTEEFVSNGIIIPQRKILKTIQAEVIAISDKPTYKDEELRINKERQMLVNVGDIVLLNCMSTVDVFDAIDFDGKTIRKFMFVNPNFISVKYATTRTTTRK